MEKAKKVAGEEVQAQRTGRPHHGLSLPRRREQRKLIYFMRHGVAVHNVPDATTGKPPDASDSRFTDTPLVPHGERQVQLAGDKVRRDLKRRNIDMLVSSPLTRCLQTSLLAFPSSEIGPSAGDLRSEKTLYYCHDGVREAYGIHYPDKRRSVSSLRPLFPTFKFDAAMSEEDESWKPDKRETWSDVVERVDNFFHWLSTRAGDVVVVVSHGIWIETALRWFCPSALGADGKTRVHNADVYRGEFVASLEADQTDMHGATRRTIQLQNVRLLED